MQRVVQHTLGLTNNALNFENTLNISFALLAVPSLSLNCAMVLHTRHSHCKHSWRRHKFLSHLQHKVAVRIGNKALSKNSPTETSRTSVRFMTSYASLTSSSISTSSPSSPSAKAPSSGPSSLAAAHVVFSSPLDTSSSPGVSHVPTAL
jgi:hypothetical protein